jgi:ComEC/Rec2-related protein
VAGVRSGIPEEVNEALRRTGLAHFLAISGLHMALVAGTVVGGMRALFALFPGFASRHPVKKYAALSALIAITVYLVISGAAVAAQRSFIMFAVMLAAVLVDRAALTMRNLAIAGLIVLAIAPHEIMGPSFQMSFAATAALIGAYAWFSERRRAKAVDGSWREMPIWRRGLHVTLLFFGGLAMTSLIAGTATGLYGAWHFNRVAPLGLVANLAAMPIVTVAVMPMAVIGTVLIPLGLDALFFAVMGKALAAVVEIARWLSERSPLDEVGLVPPAAVAILSVALAIATIATTWLRTAALPLLIAGGALIVMRDVPDVLVSEDGRLVAMRMSDGSLAVNRGRPSAFTVDNWTKALQGRGLVKPSDDISRTAAEHPFACRDGLCLARHRSGAGVAFAGNAEAAGLACERVALMVIDDATAEGGCSGAGPLVITKRDLARKGAAAISFTAGGEIAGVEFAVGAGERPWHRQRRYSREARGMPPYQRNRPATSEEVPTARSRAPASPSDGQVAAAADQ